MMTREQLLNYHDMMSDRASKLMEVKNNDYAGEELDGNVDVFANFRRCEALGLCSAETGILIRLSDKMSRATTFINTGELKVKDEQIDDLVLDGINYWILLGAMVRSRRDAQNKTDVE